ncbi:hypothetical protein ACFX2C_014890 [Malus domestica]
MFCYRCGKLGHARGCPHPARLLANKESKYNESLKVETLSRVSYLLFLQRRIATATGVHETHWRRKWEGRDGGLYGLLDTEMDILMHWFLATQKDKEQVNPRTTRPATGPEFAESSGTYASLVPREKQTRTSYLIGSDRVEEYPPTTSWKVSPDYGHLWHPDSYGTQFTNDTLTITVNRLSLNKDWYDPSRIPPWALQNVGGLLNDAETVKKTPACFSMMGCFPLGTNRENFDAQSLQIVTQLVAADRAAHMVRSGKGAQMANINEATEDIRVPTNATALGAQVKNGKY